MTPVAAVAMPQPTLPSSSRDPTLVSDALTRVTRGRASRYHALAQTDPAGLKEQGGEGGFCTYGGWMGTWEGRSLQPGTRETGVREGEA